MRAPRESAVIPESRGPGPPRPRTRTRRPSMWPRTTCRRPRRGCRRETGADSERTHGGSLTRDTVCTSCMGGERDRRRTRTRPHAAGHLRGRFSREGRGLFVYGLDSRPNLIPRGDTQQTHELPQMCCPKALIIKSWYGTSRYEYWTHGRWSVRLIVVAIALLIALWLGGCRPDIPCQRAPV